MTPDIITTLSPSGAEAIEREERRTKSRLLEQCQFGEREVNNCLQLEPWDAYIRKSAASAYEQERLQFALDRLVKVCGRDFVGGPFITYVNPEHQVEIGQLATVDPNKILRPMAKAITQLRRRHPDLAGVAVAEVNVRRNLKDELVWNPHFHAVLVGPSNAEVRAAFPNPDVVAGQQNKWLQAKKVLDLEVLKYVAKFKCEMMVAYQGDDGKARTKKNKPPSKLETEWLAFMASHPIKDLVRLIGFSPTEVQKFWSVEIAWPRTASRRRSI